MNYLRLQAKIQVLKVIITITVSIAANVVRLRSLVCPDKSSPSGDKSEIDEVILSLPLQPRSCQLQPHPQKPNCAMQSAAAAAKKHNRKAPKKNRQRMSKKQKLLRKRVEAEKLKAEDLEEDDSKVDVKVKYSVNYLYWAVNNSDDDDDEDEESEVETTVVLPLKSLRLKS